MAEVGELDFRGFVSERRNTQRRSDDPGGATAYSYASDRETREKFEKAKPLQWAVEACVRVFKTVNEGPLLGHAVKVGPRQLSRVHALADGCAKTLDIETPAVYVINSPYLNAATLGTHDNSFIMVHSALIDHFNDEELLSVIGHECGHIHNSHVVYLTALHVLTSLTQYVNPVAYLASYAALMSWSRRAEITCDRAGMLCSKDLDVSTRALAKLALGSKKLYEELDIEVFLEQYEESKSQVGSVVEAFSTHPWLPKRVLALREFAKSNLYQSHVASENKDDGLSMSEVDDNVHNIIKVVK